MDDQRYQDLVTLAIGGLNELAILGLISRPDTKLCQIARADYDRLVQSSVRPAEDEWEPLLHTVIGPREGLRDYRVLLEDIWSGKAIEWCKERRHADQRI